MTVRMERLPAHMRQKKSKSKRPLLPPERDAKAINSVLAGAGLQTRVRLRDRSGKFVFRLMGNPHVGQLVLYELVSPPGEKIARVKNLTMELANELTKARKGTPTVPRLNELPLSIEVPHWNEVPLSFVPPRTLPPHHARMGMTLDLHGVHAFTIDMEETPHLLVTGRTGAGKSIALNNLISTLAWSTSPQKLRIFLVDPKNRDLLKLRGLPQVVEAVHLDEDTTRIARLFDAELTRRIHGAPYDVRWVLVIDEFETALDATPEIEGPLMNLARQGRAYNMNLIAGTQKPIASSINTTIKSQFSARFVGSVASTTDATNAAGVPDTGAETIRLRSGRFVAVMGGVSIVQTFFLDNPAPFVADIVAKWRDETPDDVHVVVDDVVIETSFGDDEIGQIALAIQDQYQGFVAGEVSQNELIRIAHAKGALKAKSPYGGGPNVTKIKAAIERIARVVDLTDDNDVI